MFKKERLFGAILFIIVMAGYIYTITPTLPFWDCGEFIACSFTMGVPHPPGTPLMVLLGNLFIRIFFFVKEVAVRVNLLSAFSSGFSALLLYLIMMNIFGKLNDNSSLKTQWINIIASFSAGLAGAFMYSLWLTSVEAEVYSPSTFITLLIIWIALKGWERLNDENDDRFIFLIIYIAVLSIGISMQPLLALPGCLIFFIIVGWDKHYDLSVSLISFSVFFTFLYLGMTKENFGMVIAGAIIAVLAAVGTDYLSKNKKLNYSNLFKYLAIYIILSIIAMTPYIMLIIRARFNPYINIAAPITFSDLWDVFNRKQYGPMVLLPRNTDIGFGTVRGLWEQFAVFYKYYTWQFGAYFRPIQEVVGQSGRFIASLLMAVITASGLFGMYSHFKKEKKTFIILIVTFFLLSAGLIVYLNLKYSPSDPILSHQPREVRERDYFYMPAYFFFMLFVAFGFRELMMSFAGKLKQTGEKIKGFIFNPAEITVITLIVIISVMPFIMNFHSDANRRGNWIADEYAKNMLLTPNDNSIVFTNGDNDTYPLWFEQTVRDYRTFKPGKEGVLVVNLSLLNVGWYIKQMQSYGVPISMTDREIDALLPVRLPNNEVLNIRDIVIRDIIYHNTTGEKTPQKYLYANSDKFRDEVLSNYKADSINVYFSVTVSEGARIGYKENLILEGLAFRVVGDEEAAEYPDLIDVRKTRYMTDSVYSYDYILDDKLVTDDNVDRIMTNYASGFLQLGIYYATLDSFDLAVDYFKRGRTFYTYDRTSVTMNVVQILRKQGRYDEAIEEVSSAMEMEKDPNRYAALTTLMAEIYLSQKNYDDAMTIYKDISEKYPDEPAGYVGMMRIYKMTDSAEYNKIMARILTQPQQLGNAIGFLYMQKLEKDILLEMLNSWLEMRPEDIQARQLKEDVEKW